MLRRTHHDRLFGEKILDLPEAKQTTIWLELDGPDRVVYLEVLRYYIKRAEELGGEDRTINLRLD